MVQHDKCLDRAVEREINEAYKKRAPFRRNLAISKNTLQPLGARMDIVIKPADKGGAVVIIDEDDYIKDAHRQLSDSSFYKTLPCDPTDDFKCIVKDSLAQLLEDKK